MSMKCKAGLLALSAALFGALPANAQDQTYLANGNYILTNVASGLLLNLDGANAADNTPIIEWPLTEPLSTYQNQVWTFNNTQPGSRWSSIGTFTALNPQVGFSCNVYDGCISSGSSWSEEWFISGDGSSIMIMPNGPTDSAITGTGTQGDTVSLQNYINNPYSMAYNWIPTLVDA